MTQNGRVQDGGAGSLLRRYLGLQGLLLAFAVVDAVGLVVVMQLARLDWLGYAAAAVAIAAAVFGFRDGTSDRLRAAALGLLVFLLLALPQGVLIAAQPANAPVHDGVLLTDAAAGRLLQGQDPYGHDYIDSRARSFYLSDVPVNFGLRHYVYMPGMILLDLPVRALGGDRANFTWMFLPGLLALALACWSVGRRQAESQAALIAVVLNPLFQLDYLYFLNDLFALAPALAAVGMLRRGRPLLAGILLGLAIGTKQQAVLFLPLFLIAAGLLLRRRGALQAVSATFATAAFLALPFLAWNPGAFVADTAAFFFGSGVDAYPIRGIGLPGDLLALGVLQSRWEAFSTPPFQAFAVLLVLATGLNRLWRRWSWPEFWFWLGLETLAVFFFGRVLAPNYLDLALTILGLSFTLWLVDQAPAQAAIGRPVEAAPRQRGIEDEAGLLRR